MNKVDREFGLFVGGIIVMAVLFGLIFGIILSTSTFSTQSNNYHSFTKAICDYHLNNTIECYPYSDFDEVCNYTQELSLPPTCQDFYIECQGKEMINIIPIGEPVQMPEKWTDPRPIEQINKGCGK
jgi:hypothetical protein